MLTLRDITDELYRKMHKEWSKGSNAENDDKIDFNDAKYRDEFDLFYQESQKDFGEFMEILGLDEEKDKLKENRIYQFEDQSRPFLEGLLKTYKDKGGIYKNFREMTQRPIPDEDIIYVFEETVMLFKRDSVTSDEIQRIAQELDKRLHYRRAKMNQSIMRMIERISKIKEEILKRDNEERDITLNDEMLWLKITEHKVNTILEEQQDIYDYIYEERANEEDEFQEYLLNYYMEKQSRNEITKEQILSEINVLCWEDETYEELMEQTGQGSARLGLLQNSVQQVINHIITGIKEMREEDAIEGESDKHNRITFLIREEQAGLYHEYPEMYEDRMEKKLDQMAEMIADIMEQWPELEEDKKKEKRKSMIDGMVNLIRESIIIEPQIKERKTKLKAEVWRKYKKNPKKKLDEIWEKNKKIVLERYHLPKDFLEKESDVSTPQFEFMSSECVYKKAVIKKRHEEIMRNR